jgi:uncharacterized protein (DUF1501 family)
MTHRFRSCEALARRDFLRIGTAGLFGLGLPQLLELEARARAASPERARERRAQSVIFVWLAGGPPTIDMWDLKPDAPDGIRGEFRPIATRAGGVQVCEHLPRMAAMMDKCTVVRSLAHTVAEHGLATTFMTTGNRPTPVLRYPNLGSVVARLSATPSGAAPFVAVRAPGGQALGDVAGYLGSAYDPFELEVTRPAPTADAVVDTRGVVLPVDFPVAQLDSRNALAQSFDRAFDAAHRNPELANALGTFQRQALDILRSNRTRDALNLGREQHSVRERYGRPEFAQGCLAARRLIEAGVRFVTVRSEFNTWDTHNQNFSILRTRNLPQLDQALSALIRDLDEHGLLDSTIVYCAGEFGRTPRINANAGRDHWARSMAVVLAGGGFKRGFVYGSTDAQGMAPATDRCTPDDIAATILHQLGIDPHQELQTPTGRPVQLVREGHVLSDLGA